jgi:hypothetical protein
VVALETGTHVNIDGQDFTLDPLPFRDLAPGALHHIVADRPVVVVTVGGNGLNDWEAALRLIGR